MSNALSPTNSQGSQLELRQERYTGATRLVRAVGGRTVTGSTTPVADTGVATHYAGEAFHEPAGGSATPDPIVVVGGVVRFATTLGAAITTTDGTAVTLTAATGMPATQFVLTVNTEDLLVTAGYGTTSVTVVRGWNGTTAATHLDGAAAVGSVALPAVANGRGELLAYGTSGTLAHGARAMTDGARIAISAASVPCQGVLVKASPGNAEAVYVGGAAVTPDVEATGGYPLAAGESVGVPCRDATEVYIVGTGTDSVAFLASAD